MLGKFGTNFSIYYSAYIKKRAILPSKVDSDL